MMNTHKIKNATSESRIQDSYEAIKTSILNGEDPEEIGERIGWMTFEEEMTRLKAQEQKNQDISWKK